MSHITTIDPVEDLRWDRFVEDHPFGWIAQLSGWKVALEKSFNHMTGYYFVLLNDSESKILAALPVFDVKSWITGRRLVSIPYATLCDPLVSTAEEMDLLLKAVLKLSEELKCSYVEIRTLSSSNFMRSNGFGEIDFFKHHYLMLKDSPDQLKKRFHRTCVRQRISRAKKSNLTLLAGHEAEHLDKFYKLHLVTRRRLARPPQPYQFFKNLWEAFPDNLTLLIAQTGRMPIAGLILLKFKDRVSAEFAASDEAFRDLSPNHFVFWEAIKLCYEEGYKIFDFGRTSPTNNTLMDFKRRWGTEVIDLPQFFYPQHLAEETLTAEGSWKFKLMSKICEDAPNFIQKAVGNFCYRHLG